MTNNEIIERLEQNGRLGIGRVPESAIRIAELAAEQQVTQNAPKPILMGRHLIELGMEPGPPMGEILRKAFDAQLDGEFDKLEDAIVFAQKGIIDD